MKLINLTPHPIQIWVGDEMRLKIDPEPNPARVKEEFAPYGTLYSEAGAVPLTKGNYTQVYNLPGPELGVWYIVSILVAQVCPSREDLLVPYDLVRDKNGGIKGCRSLMILEHK